MLNNMLLSWNNILYYIYIFIIDDVCRNKYMIHSPSEMTQLYIHAVETPAHTPTNLPAILVWAKTS